jgi:hypothetical protein
MTVGQYRTYAKQFRWADILRIACILTIAILTARCAPSRPPAKVSQSTTLPATRPNSPTFASEMAAAKKAANRDEKVLHLSNALALRPDDPENLRIEFDLGIELGQRYPPRQHESLEVFENIIKQYDHKAYYTIEPEDSSESPELMVPRAGILCSSILNSIRQHNAARAYDEVAMNNLRWTFEKRKSDWLNIPKPIQSPLEDAMGRPGDFERQVQYWQHRRDLASAGEVDLLGPYGKTLVEAAVRQYRQSFAPADQKDLSGIMGKIIQDFPNTPLATEAQRVMDAAHAPGS